jgi:hypothetical protein
MRNRQFRPQLLYIAAFTLAILVVGYVLIVGWADPSIDSAGCPPDCPSAQPSVR